VAILASNLIDEAKALADKRNDASIADSDWLIYVNWAVKALYRRLVALDPDLYFATTDFTLTNTPAGSAKDMSSLGTTTPANALFVALHGLDKDPDTPVRRTIQRRNFQERNRGRIGWWYPTIIAVDRAYDLRGRTLVVTPYENAAGNYRAYFRQRPYIFTSPVDGTALDVALEDYDEYIALSAAMKGLNIEESSSDSWAIRLAELLEELTDEHDRDDEAPGVIADVEADTDNSTGGWW
jgi:hypothetical protein